MDSFISWLGGKKFLRKHITDRFPKLGKGVFEKYIEVFGGAGWVLFYKDKHAPFEVYNDINSSLVNLFKCMKYHPQAVLDELDNIPNSREVFNSFKDLQHNPHLTDIQRAAIYLYLIKYSFGAKIETFGSRLPGEGTLNLDYFLKVKERLKSADLVRPLVVIENKGWDALVKQYDRPHTLFYCDPPYVGSERSYNHGGATFDKEEHERLAETLKNIKGKFILSYNDNEFVRGLYKGLNIEAVDRQNNLSQGTRKEAYKELIIRNYE